MLIADRFYTFAFSTTDDAILSINFGQDPTFGGSDTSGTSYTTDTAEASTGGEFRYQPPDGYKALKGENLPGSGVDVADHFKAVTYVGTGATNARTDVGFQPDLVWIKNRGTPGMGAGYHAIFDAERAATKYLSSNNSDAETTDTASLTAFTSSGFTVGASDGFGDVTVEDDNYIAWCWKMPTDGSDGSGGDQVDYRYNDVAKWSVLKWTGNDTADREIIHHCGAIPTFIIIKNLSSSDDWVVHHKSLSSGYYMKLNLTDGEAGSSDFSALTDTKFEISSSSTVNANPYEYICYCFTASALVSTGSYTGNSAADGPFLSTGTSPEYALLKIFGSGAATDEPWQAYTRALSANVNDAAFSPNNDAAVGSTHYVDLLSNGVKIRNSARYINLLGVSHLFFAIGQPLRNANAR